MNLSGSSEDESSCDDSPMPAKRPRADTYGASSTTSHGSVLQESDEDTAENQNVATSYHDRELRNPRAPLNYKERAVDRDMRQSRSSLSENCSSPNDQYDNEYRSSFDDQDPEATSASSRPHFQEGGESGFYNKSQIIMDSAEPVKGSDKLEPGSTESVELDLQADYSDTAKQMMLKMGFKSGKGLGKFEHGRIEPIEASTQKGRRGLGLKPSVLGEVPRDFKWTPDESEPEAKEVVLWMPPPPDYVLSGDQLDEWLVKDEKKLTIDDETDFVDPQILSGVLNAKKVFDSLYDEDLRKARFRSNPYETIGSVFFLNRAAVKMANLDAVFENMFTKPKTPNGERVVGKNEILYFADVCAGPGGFSEYVFYRRKWKAKGFGFTLKGANDFKLSDFLAGTAETFNPYYGVADDGNIFNPANLTSLKNHVLKQTDDKGVHFLMADGGFSVEGQENLQEILSKQLYLCQCLAALMLVRTGGHFLVKLFDVFTPFSVGLIYILYHCFDKVCIHKPVTSRPANSERYLVCKWKKLGTEAVEQHLFSVNSTLWQERDQNSDVTHLVPIEVMQKNEAFYEYIYNSNCSIGEKQIKSLMKIAEFSKNKNLEESHQAKMREQCLMLWNLPDELRTQPERMEPENVLTTMITTMALKPPEFKNTHAFKINVLGAPATVLNNEDSLKNFKCVFDWYFIFLNTKHNGPDLKLFLGCGGKQVYCLDGSRWTHHGGDLLMPAKTLLYGELVKELCGEGIRQIHTKALHVIDAMMLGGIDVSHLPLTERLNECALFCNALSKPFDSQYIPIKCKRIFNMESFPSAMDRLEYKSMKMVRKAVTIAIPNRVTSEEKFHVVSSILFIKAIKEPWQSKISSSTGHKYYFTMGRDKKLRSEYYIPPEALMDMISAYTTRIIWPWEPASAIFESLPHPGLTRAQMEQFIQAATNR